MRLANFILAASKISATDATSKIEYEEEAPGAATNAGSILISQGMMLEKNDSDDHSHTVSALNDNTTNMLNGATLSLTGSLSGISENTVLHAITVLNSDFNG